jgi:hypothetical protein
MNTIAYLPGTEINTVGTVERLHFTDLFNTTYIVDDTPYSNEDIKDKILSEKEVITNKLFDLLQRKQDFAFKFLTKMALKTQSIPLINSLNHNVEHLQNLLNKESFSWSSYSNYSEAKTYLKKFLFNYYTRTIE